MNQTLKKHFFKWLLCLLFIPIMGQANSATQSANASHAEIEQLVAPIALYPDSVVAQILMASTYPLEVIQADRWIKNNPKLTGENLEDALEDELWDPSVKALTALPQVLDMMSQKLEMTQKLGDIFLAQQSDVFDAIQRLRKRAMDEGHLNSSKEQTVSTETGADSTIITIVQSNPQVVYVPTYNPTVVYGAWPYPSYPPYYYYPPHYVAGQVFAFSVGVAVGHAIWGHCNWHHGRVDININRYNNFNRNKIKNKNWNHKPSHRKGVPYRNKANQAKYGKSQRKGAASREVYRGHLKKSGGKLPTKSNSRVNSKPTRSTSSSLKKNTSSRSKNTYTRSNNTNVRKNNTSSRNLSTRQSTSNARQSDAFSNVGNGRSSSKNSRRGASSLQRSSRSSSSGFSRRR